MKVPQTGFKPTTNWCEAEHLTARPVHHILRANRRADSVCVNMGESSSGLFVIWSVASFWQGHWLFVRTTKQICCLQLIPSLNVVMLWFRLRNFLGGEFLILWLSVTVRVNVTDSNGLVCVFGCKIDFILLIQKGWNRRLEKTCLQCYRHANLLGTLLEAPMLLRAVVWAIQISFCWV